MINKTVLIVERDPAEAQKLLEFFWEHNFRNRLEVVRSKPEALDFIFKTGKYKDRKDDRAPGLILLDLMTNRTQDIKVLKPLQYYLQTQNIPIIILISSEQQAKEVDEYHLGTVEFVRKPFDFTHFIEVIQHMGMTWKVPEIPQAFK